MPAWFLGTIPAWPLVLLFLLIGLHSSSVPPARPAAPVAAPVARPAPRPAPAATVRSRGAELLASRTLAVPVQGISRKQVRDNFLESRGGGRVHKAIDIMAPWGTPVLAADDGKVAKISRNRGGGLSLYLVDPSGRLVYYYAHLAGYADHLREGQPVQRGDLVAYVGSTGNAPAHAPHLHFAVQFIDEDDRWWRGEVLNPYEVLAREDPPP